MSRLSQTPNWLKSQPVLLGIILTIFAFFTFFWNYTNPPYLYWDENYHIASAQKYLNGTFFMEPHPPLAKMLIAAGEAIFDANEGLDDEFIGTDYAKELPGGFSFQGYRFFPVLFGWLIAPLMYLIFLLITRKPIWAFLLSFLYVFDTALVTHSRAAMLDSIMLFFCVALVALYFLILRYKENKNGFPLTSLLFGIVFGCAMATKALALIMVLLWPLLILHLRTDSQNPFALARPKFSPQKIGQFFVLTIAGFLITYVGIWQLHFSMGKTVVDSLPDKGYYQASESYKALVDAGQVDTQLMLRENLHFLRHYSRGVPSLNLCKSDENGSPFYFWPLGARSINYRWETPDGSYYQYITLQANPIIWGAALLGLILAFALLIGSAIIPGTKLKYKNELLIWCGMWTAYMIAVSQIDRVMYLYHYFIPLLVSFIILSYVLLELKQLGTVKLTDGKKNWIILILGLLIFAGFQFYRPLTYYEPIDDKAFKKRMVFPLWDLRCVNCERGSKLALPLKSEE
tara:strand:- start:6472 stop:8016 length:1545 start_codon:yes stop_codon:yes gene_type:complete